MVQGRSVPVLEARGVSKAFPGVQALDRVDFRCHRGEIHGLVGENGAGKSTLIHVLMGVVRPDGGRLLIDGRPVQVRTPAEARFRFGIDCVFQESSLVPSLTVAENVFLGREREFYVNGLISRSLLVKRTRKLLSELSAESGVAMPNPQEPVDRLDSADRKLVEIARAMASPTKVLILDEVTALFTPDQVLALFAILGDLKKKGTSIIFSSHRMGEIQAVCDRATVLKDGRFVDAVDAKKTSDRDLIRLVTGKNTGIGFPPRAKKPGEPVVSVKGVTVKGVLENISLQLHRGEIVALAGLRGQGQSELLRLLGGHLAPEEGEIRIDGVPVRLTRPRAAIRTGIAYLSDRRSQELMPTFSVRKNLALPTLSRRSLLGFVRLGAERADCEQVVFDLGITPGALDQETATLSGGNKQKVALGKWILGNPRILLLDEPTQGLDVGVKAELYRMLRTMADAGHVLAVVLTDLKEILGLPDRILVLGDRRIKAELTAEEATGEKIVRAALS